MTDSAATSLSLMLDSDGRIAADTACVRCGYNLRTLRQDASCPECGAAVERSLYGDLLRYANPEWLTQLARGMNWTVYGIIGAVASLILMFMVGPPEMYTYTLPMQAGCSIVTLVGFERFTRPDPARPTEQQDLTARRIGRIGFFGAMLAGLFAYPIVQGTARPAVAIALIYLLPGALTTFGCFGLFRYLEHLAQRIPDLQLVRRTHSVRGGLLVGLLLFLGVAAFRWLIAWFRWMIPTRINDSLNFVVVVALILLVVYAYRALRLLMQYRKQLRQVLEQAKQNWNATTVPSTPPAAPGNQP